MSPTVFLSKKNHPQSGVVKSWVISLADFHFFQHVEDISELKLLFANQSCGKSEFEKTRLNFPSPFVLSEYHFKLSSVISSRFTLCIYG